MAGRTRLINAPPARGRSAHGAWNQVAGSMGALVGDGAAPLGTPAVAEKFEAPELDDSQWEQTIRQREAAEGLAATPESQRAPHTLTFPSVQDVRALPVPPQATPRLPADLSGLPDAFTFVIQRKPDGWWKVSAPDQHVGLFVAHQDLLTALADAPGALAQILRLDGPVPAARKRRAK